MDRITNFTNAASRNAIPLVIGCAIGYLASRAVQWIYQGSSSKNSLEPSEVQIDIISIKRNVNKQLCQKVTKVSLAEFLKIVPYEELNSLRESVGWLTRTNEIWDKVLRNSSYITCVVQKDEDGNRIQLIANAFLIGNGRMATVMDVAVRPEYQRQKFGTLVMNQLVEHINGPGQTYAGINLIVSENENKHFYEKFGFKECIGMEAWGKNLSQSK